MANNLDLEEQEQLAELKHFWDQWGNLITWLLIAVLATIITILAIGILVELLAFAPVERRLLRGRGLLGADSTR